MVLFMACCISFFDNEEFESPFLVHNRNLILFLNPYSSQYVVTI